MSYGRVGDFGTTIEPTNDSHEQMQKIASASVYAVGCTQESPGQYKYIERTLDTINSGLREYLKDNPEHVALLKETSSTKISEFKKLSATEKHITCGKINNNLRDLYYPSND